jgi:uncharacterized 2Fe-2S/4Fe-4S cluster protein (DUF4445 family)
MSGQPTEAAAAATTARAQVTVALAPHGLRVPARVGDNLLDVIEAAGIKTAAPCGGQGRCGRCRVKITSGTVRRRRSPSITRAEEREGWALACQATLRGDVAVLVPSVREIEGRPRPDTSAEKLPLPISCNWEHGPAIRQINVTLDPPSLGDNTNDLDRLRRELYRQHGIRNIVVGVGVLRTLAKALRDADWNVTLTVDMRQWVLDATVPPRLLTIGRARQATASYGLAVDVGTTSVVVHLVDLSTAQIVDTASSYNGQISCGDDVISRIVYSQRQGGLERLHQLVIGTINSLLQEIAARNQIDLVDIYEITLAGNTTMTHLFLGLDPKYIREEPYIPTFSIAPRASAGRLGLNTNPHASVYCMPSVGSYVGGDITAGVLSSGLFLTDKLTLFVDIGTNGEMVLGNKDWLICCACSAGPALEGGGVRDGMRATVGAIEDVWIDPATYEPAYRTVGNRPPQGICGSGLIDLVAELFVTGLIDKSGRMSTGARTPRLRAGQYGPEYVVVWGQETARGRDIVITESDIENLTRAKAAIFAGFRSLCRNVGVDLADVEQILIGGAFGQYINIEKAIEIGLMPDLPWQRFRYFGNTSAMGAYTALVCTDMRHEVVKIAGRMTYLELSADTTFMDEYTSALFLPHTDLDAFPSTKRRAAALARGHRRRKVGGALPAQARASAP